jgi:hypothetical protein
VTTISGPQIFCDSGLIRDGKRLLFRSKGGRIVYESHGRLFPFELELAVPGFFVYFPKQLTELPTKERETILEALRAWLSAVGYLPQPIVPVDYSEEEETCLMAGCTLKRIKGRYLCSIHLQGNFADFSESAMEHFIPAQSSV